MSSEPKQAEETERLAHLAKLMHEVTFTTDDLTEYKEPWLLDEEDPKSYGNAEDEYTKTKIFLSRQLADTIDSRCPEHLRHDEIRGNLKNYYEITKEAVRTIPKKLTVIEFEMLTTIFDLAPEQMEARYRSARYIRELVQLKEMVYHFLDSADVDSLYRKARLWNHSQDSGVKEILKRITNDDWGSRLQLVKAGLVMTKADEERLTDV